MCMKQCKYMGFAKKNIVCWKVVQPKSKTYVVSVYRQMPLKVNKVINALGSTLLLKDADFIHSGAFHSFKRKCDAKMTVQWQGAKGSEVVVRCLIPKGTPYWKGTFGIFARDNYCSTQIIIVR